MDASIKTTIFNILETHKILTLATLRDDGWPQATTVTYAHDDLILYIGVAQNSQKIQNIEKCNKVSLTIDHDADDWNKIKGLSMAAIAEVINDPDDFEHAAKCLTEKYPRLKKIPDGLDKKTAAIIKLKPKVISVLNYELGFNHADLVYVN